MAAKRNACPHTRSPVGHAQSRSESGTCQMRKCSPCAAAFPPHSPPTRFCLGSNDSSVLRRSVTPRRRACGPCGLGLRPPTCRRLGPTGVCEVSRFSCMKFLGVPWGLRPRRTGQELALPLPSMWPSAHVNRVGVRVVCFRGSMSHPAHPLSTLHCVPRGSSARLEAKWIATPFLARSGRTARNLRRTDRVSGWHQNKQTYKRKRNGERHSVSRRTAV